MNVPARSAALMIISPLRAVTSRPSRRKLTEASTASSPAPCRGPCSAIRAGPFLDVDQELVAEHLDGGIDGRGDGRAEDADGGLLGRPGQSGGDVVRHVQEEIEGLLAPLPVLDPVQDPLEPAGPLA